MIIQDTSTLIRIYDFNVPNELNDPNDPNVLNEIDQIKLPRLSCLPRETELVDFTGVM